MNILKYAAVIAALSLCISCSKKAPAYPDAGLVIDNGGATCGFYSRHEVDGNLTVTLTTSEMEYSEKGHKLSIKWISEHGRARDKYDFTITVDGATSRKSVIYVGEPITLMDTPFKVTIESVKP
jgi:hypothetical protein